VTHKWVDCDRETASRRYDLMARHIAFFDRLLFLPPHMRCTAVERLGLSRGDRVLEIGCGTGNGFPFLQRAIGLRGKIYGVDISPRMLDKAKERCNANNWRNVELQICDAADYTAPGPIDGILFSLSYNTMPHHRMVLRRAWDQLRPGGRLVIMDAKVPSGPAEKIILPFSLWLMKHTMLGNPLIKPWKELAEIAEVVHMDEYLFKSYYICHAMKPGAERPVNGRDTLMLRWSYSRKLVTA
jgi:ubiquinone/menaquinone biosynthesis C-methylase UbiE